MKEFYKVTSITIHLVELTGNDLAFAYNTFPEFVPYFFKAINHLLDGKNFDWE